MYFLLLRTDFSAHFPRDVHIDFNYFVEDSVPMNVVGNVQSASRKTIKEIALT